MSSRNSSSEKKLFYEAIHMLVRFPLVLQPSTRFAAIHLFLSKSYILGYPKFLCWEILFLLGTAGTFTCSNDLLLSCSVGPAYPLPTRGYRAAPVNSRISGCQLIPRIWLFFVGGSCFFKRIRLSGTRVPGWYRRDVGGYTLFKNLVLVWKVRGDD